MSHGDSDPRQNPFGNEKAKPKKLSLEKIPQVKLVLLDILRENASFWKNLNKSQIGIEKFILFRKVSEKVPVPSILIEIALEDLSLEENVIPYSDGNLTRYLIMTFP